MFTLYQEFPFKLFYRFHSNSGSLQEKTGTAQQLKIQQLNAMSKHTQCNSTAVGSTEMGQIKMQSI